MHVVEYLLTMEKNTRETERKRGEGRERYVKQKKDRGEREGGKNSKMEKNWKKGGKTQRVAGRKGARQEVKD